MKENKYKEEYKLVTEIDAKGRPRQILVYMGDYYVYRKDMPLSARMKAALPWLMVFTVCYVVYMAWGSPSSYCIYVLPFACCAIVPLMYAGIGAANVIRFTGRMTRVQKETGIARLMRSLIGCGIFTALAAAGDVVFMLRNGFAEEWLAALLLAAASASAWLGFAAARRLHNSLTVLPGRRAQEAGEQP